MNQNHQRPLSSRVEIRRLDDPTRNFSSQRAGPGDFFGGLEIERRNKRIVRFAQLSHAAAVDIRAINFIRRRHAAA